MDLIFDVLHCDTFDVTMPGNAATRAHYSSLAEAAKAHCALLGLELLDFDQVMYHPTPDGNVKLSIRGTAWLRHLRN